MKRLLFIAFALTLLPAVLLAGEPSDTLRVSDLFTTHIIFNTDLIYADLSNSQVVAAKILDQSKNMMALKARTPFSSPLSVSALESNGTMHTFIVLYDPDPGTLIWDMRGRSAGGGAGLYRRADAPLLKDVVESPQRLWHLTAKRYDIEIVCTNILSYSDITYIVFNVRNRSGVSYECPDAAFVVESCKRSRKSVVYDRSLFPRSRSGTASCEPKGSTRLGYSLDKVSLSKDQVLRVYFYELGGQRELVLTIGAKDINRAKSAL